MTTEEYIKSLEERIQTLEKMFNDIVLDDKQNVIFNGCSINAVAAEKCKNITVSDCKIEANATIGFSAHVSNCTIHNFDYKDSKVVLRKCHIHNQNANE